MDPILWTTVFLVLDSTTWTHGVSSTLFRRSEDVWLPYERLVQHPGNNVVISLLLFGNIQQQLYNKLISPSAMIKT